MKNKLLLPGDFPGAGSRRAAFTLTELLVVLAVIGLLACLQLHGFAGAGSDSKARQCAGNLRQFALATILYATDNRDLLPASFDSPVGWPWDLSNGTADKLMKSGAKREFMYCPAFPEQNNDALWNWSSNRSHIIGYAMAFASGGRLLAIEANRSLVPQAFRFGGTTIPAPEPNARVLLADVVISRPGQTNPANRADYQYTGITGGYKAPGWEGHRTSHLDGQLPAGGNLAMLDGHVEWRDFAAMMPRTMPNMPVFWW